MRLLLTGVFLGILALSLPAFAAGNVLLPADNKSGSKGNLGTAPVNPVPKEAPKATPQQTPSLIPNLSGGAPALSAGELPYTPALPPAGSIYSSEALAGLKTNIIKLPAQPQVSNTSNLPHSLDIRISEQSAWSSNDLSMINMQLGLTKDQVSSVCKLSAGGMITTDKTPAVFDTGLTSQAKAFYDGTITGTAIHTQALCSNKINVPKNAGVLVQVGDNFVVMLDSINCSPPTKKPVSLALLRNADGQGQCQYQY